MKDNYNLEQMEYEQSRRRRRELGLSFWQNDDGHYWIKDWKWILAIAAMLISAAIIPIMLLYGVWWSYVH